MSLTQRIKPLAGIAITAFLTLTLAACGSSGSGSTSTTGTSGSNGNDKTITIGASPSPHAEMLENLKDEFKKDGYTLKIVEYNDYIQPNVALTSGDLDANFFQHKPYLDDYNKENNTDIVSAGAIHFEPMGLYAGKSSDIKNVPDGAKIAVPSDATNEARALLLLQDQGVIKLKEGAGLKATKNDIADNPHHIEFLETEAASVPRSLDDSDFAIINGNFALSAKLDTSHTLASEGTSSEAAKTYANIVAVRKDSANFDKTKEIIKVLTSDASKKFIDEQYKGAVIPVF